MSGLNVGEIGQVLIVNVGEDISAATEAVIVAQPEVGQTKEFIATIPDTDTELNGVTYLAGEYAQYTTAGAEDLDYAGRWRMRLKATFSPADVRLTSYSKFRVLP